MVRRGFTLVELLVIITIIGLVTVLVAPAVLSAYRGSSVTQGAEVLRAAIVAARDRASAADAPAGIRLLPSPAMGALTGADQAWAADRWVELAIPPEYATGRCSIYPSTVYNAAVDGNRPCLVLEESPGEWTQDPSSGAWSYLPIEPTNWWYLVRLGERVRIGANEYTVCGPYSDANAEGMVNIGPAGTASPIARTLTAPDGVTRASIRPQFLLLTDRQDGDRDGFVDEGFDGIDNDLHDGPDDLAEWEVESWRMVESHGGENLAYAIRRRPAPTGAPHALPSGVVVDLSTWGTTRERSRCAVDGLTGSADILVGRDGAPVWDSIHGTAGPSGMDSGWVHLWVCGVDDIRDPDIAAASGACRLPIPASGKLGKIQVVSVARSGRVAVAEPIGGNAANPSGVFRAIEQ